MPAAAWTSIGREACLPQLWGRLQTRGSEREMPAEKRWTGHLASHCQHPSHCRNRSRSHGCSDDRASHVDGEATAEGGETDMVKIAATVLDMPVGSRLLHLRGRQRMGKALHPGIADVERQRVPAAQNTTHFMLSLQAAVGGETLRASGRFGRLVRGTGQGSRLRLAASMTGERVRATFRRRLAQVGPLVGFPVGEQADALGEALEGWASACMARPRFGLP